MISILKVLFTIAVVIVIYWGFKYRWRLTDMGRAMSRMSGGRPPPAPGRKGPPVAQDLVPCPKCGAYVATGNVCSCEKA